MEKNSKDTRLTIRFDTTDLKKISDLQEIFMQSGEKKTTAEIVRLALDQYYLRMKDSDNGNTYSDYVKNLVDDSNRIATRTIAEIEDKKTRALAQILYRVYLSNIFVASCFKLPDDLSRVFNHDEIEQIIKDRSAETFDQFISEFSNLGEEKEKL